MSDNFENVLATREEFDRVDSELRSVEGLSVALESIQERIRTEGVCVQDIMELRNYSDEVLSHRYPTASFTKLPSKTNLSPALEAIDIKRIALYAGAATAILGLIGKLIQMLTGDSGGGGGGGGGSVATLTATAKEKTNEITKKASEIDKRIEELEGSVKIGDLVEKALVKVLSHDGGEVKDPQYHLDQIPPVRVGFAFAFGHHAEFDVLFDDDRGLATAAYAMANLLDKIGTGIVNWLDYNEETYGKLKSNTTFDQDDYRSWINSNFRLSEYELRAAVSTLRNWDSGLYDELFRDVTMEEKYNQQLYDTPNVPKIQRLRENGPWKGEPDPKIRAGLSKHAPWFGWTKVADATHEFIMEFFPKIRMLKFDVKSLVPAGSEGLDKHIDRLSSRSTASRVIQGNAAFGFSEAEDKKFKERLSRFESAVDKLEKFLEKAKTITPPPADQARVDPVTPEMFTADMLLYAGMVLKGSRQFIQNLGKLRTELEFISKSITHALDIQNRLLTEISKELKDTAKSDDKT